MGDSLTIKDLAQRGLECDQAIDQMLSELWREFEAIEPTLAKKLAESFGSAEFSALIMIGRFKGQLSMLEELSINPMSEEDINNLLELSPKFVSQIKEGVVESIRGDTTEYTFDDQETLSNQAERVRKKYEAELIEIFKQLKEKDPDVAVAALELCEDLDAAAKYLVTPARGLAGKSPLEALENEGRKQVLELIFQLEYGIYP